MDGIAVESEGAYTRYRSKFRNMTRQHNIMALVGNGFDIQVLRALGSKMDTTYMSFYHFLKSRKFDSDNLIFRVMEEEKQAGSTAWSDIEAAIERLLKGQQDVSAIEKSLQDIQFEFSEFLDVVVTPNLLARLSQLVVEGGKTDRSLSGFLRDVRDEDRYGKMSLLQRMDIGDLLNFRFVNFNYTALLDNFVFLDKAQFDPKPFVTSDRNFNFEPNPHGFDHRIGLKKRWMVSYLLTEVVHPHGMQYTPRSILFGVDSGHKGDAIRLEKPYWAQNEVIHRAYFSDTHLFIIFGCSLGRSDRWWWKQIADALLSAPPLDNPAGLPPDLIIYWRIEGQELTADQILDRFAQASGYGGDLDFWKVLKDRAYVVRYRDDDDRVWLSPSS